MPKIPIDYQKTQIYKLCCLDPTIKDIYIGHTTNWNKRKQYHKEGCTKLNNRIYHLYVYQFIRNHHGWNNWTMVLVEIWPCNTKQKALQRERYWIEYLQAKLNKVIPGRTNQEYYKDNIEKFKQYQLENKNKIVEYKKQY